MVQPTKWSGIQICKTTHQEQMKRQPQGKLILTIDLIVSFLQRKLSLIMFNPSKETYGCPSTLGAWFKLNTNQLLLIQSRVLLMLHSRVIIMLTLSILDFCCQKFPFFKYMLWERFVNVCCNVPELSCGCKTYQTKFLESQIPVVCKNKLSVIDPTTIDIRHT